MHDGIRIVPFSKGQEKAIADICYQTGFNGKTLVNTGRFSDRRLFALCFCLYYPLFEPENCFVALDGEKVAGYIIGTQDSVSQKKKFDKLMVPLITRRAVSVTLIRYPKDFFTLLKFNKYGNEHDESPFFGSYPAHLHINLLPDCQGKGIGKELISVFEDHVRGKGAKGIHLGTSDQNETAVPFYQKLGYEIVEKKPGNLWPGVEGASSLIMAKTF